MSRLTSKSSLTANCTSIAPGSSCHVVTGATEVLLDFFSAQAREEAYSAIRKGLDNPPILQLFATSVVRAQFLKPLSEALVAAGVESNGDAEGSVTVTVAIVAAVVAFILASLICYGLMYERIKRKSGFRDKQGSSRLQSLRNKHVKYATRDSSKVQHNFARLDDSASSSDTSIVDSSFQDPQTYIPSITWSVSDITSDDSGSIRSNLSRTASKLEIIEEGEEDEEPRDRYQVPGKRRSVKEFDCAQFRRGRVYISNLSQCRKTLSMPSDADLKKSMEQDSDVDARGVAPDVRQATDIKRVHSPGRCSVQPPVSPTNREFVEDTKLLVRSNDLVGCTACTKETYIGSTENETGKVTGHSLPNPGQTTPRPQVLENGSKTLSLGNLSGAGPSEIGTHRSDAVSKAESNNDNTDMCQNIEKSCSLESVAVTSTATITDEVDSEIQVEEDLLVDDGIEVDFDVFYDAAKSGQSSGKCVNMVEPHPEISVVYNSPGGTGSTAARCQDCQSVEVIEPDEEVFYDVTSDEVSSSYKTDEEVEKSVLDESRSLYSLDMDDTIDTLTDEAKAMTSSAVLGDSIIVQLDYSGTSNESTLDDIQGSDSDDSFFVDDLSDASIDYSRIAASGDYSFKDKKLMKSSRSQILADNTNQANSASKGSSDLKQGTVEEQDSLADIV